MQRPSLNKIVKALEGDRLITIGYGTIKYTTGASSPVVQREIEVMTGVDTSGARGRAAGRHQAQSVSRRGIRQHDALAARVETRSPDPVNAASRSARHSLTCSQTIAGRWSLSSTNCTTRLENQHYPRLGCSRRDMVRDAKWNQPVGIQAHAVDGGVTMSLEGAE